jgi:hypothetical protein
MMRVMPHHYEAALHPRRWTGRDGWAALVRNIKGNSGRWAALLALVTVAAVTAGVQAASVPVVGMITAAGILAVLSIERFTLGARSARRLTLRCERWVQDVRRAMRRGRIKGSLRIASRIVSLFAALLHVRAERQNCHREAVTRLRRGAPIITLLPRLTTRSLRACA